MAEGRVVIAPNWLGDCVMAFPVLRAIRRAHPQDRLAVVARPGVAGLFRGEASADSFLERGSLLEDVGWLRRQGFGEAWLLPNSFRSAIGPFLASISERIGYDTDRRGVLLTRAIPAPPRTKHQLRDYDALLQSRGIEPDLEAPRLTIPGDASARADEALARSGLRRDLPLALVAPGAAFSWTKRWPAENYGRLAAGLAARGYATAAVIGPGEEELGSRVAAHAGHPFPVLGADLDPIGLAALLASAVVVIANDSGAAHLSAAVGTPAVVLFGPTDPGRTAPAGGPVEILDAYVFCSPCYRKDCPYGHECMRELTVEKVLEAADRLRGRR